MTVRALRARRRRLASGLSDVEALLRGTVVTQGRRCGKENCRCAHGQLHGPYTYLSVARPGRRPRLVYVPAELTETVSGQVAVLANMVESALAGRPWAGGGERGRQRVDQRDPSDHPDELTSATTSSSVARGWVWRGSGSIMRPASRRSRSSHLLSQFVDEALDRGPACGGLTEHGDEPPDGSRSA